MWFDAVAIRDMNSGLQIHSAFVATPAEAPDHKLSGFFEVQLQALLQSVPLWGEGLGTVWQQQQQQKPVWSAGPTSPNTPSSSVVVCPLLLLKGSALATGTEEAKFQ